MTVGVVDRGPADVCLVAALGAFFFPVDAAVRFGFFISTVNAIGSLLVVALTVLAFHLPRRGLVAAPQAVLPVNRARAVIGVAAIGMVQQVVVGAQTGVGLAVFEGALAAADPVGAEIVLDLCVGEGGEGEGVEEEGG